VETRTWGGDICGNSATGSNGIDIAPASTITMDTTIASFGRSIKVSLIIRRRYWGEVSW
jgi:hypothetical protein